MSGRLLVVPAQEPERQQLLLAQKDRQDLRLELTANLAAAIPKEISCSELCVFLPDFVDG